MNRADYVYIMASRRNGTIYLGVTNNLAKRVWEHRNDVGSDFAGQYGCRHLVWYEAHDDIQAARHRELQMKKWKRAWKLKEIEGANPEWDDLFETIAWNG